MASVNVVYNTLLDLVNKDQKGFITPQVFNRFAGVAQLNIYNRLFDYLKDSERLKRAQFDAGRDKSLKKRIDEDLSTFAKKATIVKENGVFEKPSDLSRIISSTVFGSVLLGQSNKVPIELFYDEEKIDRVLLSDISAPSEEFPIGLVSRDLEVFPDSINRIILRYYKIPQSIAPNGDRSTNAPTYGTVDLGNVQVYDAVGSFDFELPNHYTAMLVIEIAEMIGINLRDKDVSNFASTEQVLIQQQQSFN